jgi:hypothetical protein
MASRVIDVNTRRCPRGYWVAQRVPKHESLRAALEEGERSCVAEDSTLEGVLAEFRASRR